MKYLSPTLVEVQFNLGRIFNESHFLEFIFAYTRSELLRNTFLLGYILDEFICGSHTIYISHFIITKLRDYDFYRLLTCWYSLFIRI